LFLNKVKIPKIRIWINVLLKEKTGDVWPFRSERIIKVNKLYGGTDIDNKLDCSLSYLYLCINNININ